MDKVRVAEPRTAGIKDVASIAGVSLGTVSNVLNRPDRVSPRTRGRRRPGGECGARF